MNEKWEQFEEQRRNYRHVADLGAHYPRPLDEPHKATVALRTAARELAEAPLLEVRKELEELRDPHWPSFNPHAPAFDQALALVNAQIEAVQALGREPYSDEAARGEWGVLTGDE